jgi:hypothetical protein
MELLRRRLGRPFELTFRRSQRARALALQTTTKIPSWLIGSETKGTKTGYT